MYEWPMDVDNSVGTDCGDRGCWAEESKGGKIGTTVME